MPATGSLSRSCAPNLKGSVRCDLLGSQQVRVDEALDRGVADAAVFGGFGEREDVGVQVRNLGRRDGVLAPRRGDTCLSPAVALSSSTSELAQHPRDLVVAIALGHLRDELDVFQCALVCDGTGLGAWAS